MSLPSRNLDQAIRSNLTQSLLNKFRNSSLILSQKYKHRTHKILHILITDLETLKLISISKSTNLCNSFRQLIR